MADWVDIHKDPRHMAREKAKALRTSQWWRNTIAQGICAYCQGAFPPSILIMDHIVPLARGGRSTRGMDEVLLESDILSGRVAVTALAPGDSVGSPVVGEGHECIAWPGVQLCQECWYA